VRGIGVGVEDAGLLEDVADGIVLVALYRLRGNPTDQAAKRSTR
jgi:hypothetical protein